VQLVSAEAVDLAAVVGIVDPMEPMAILLIIMASPFDPFVTELATRAVIHPYLATWDHLSPVDSSLAFVIRQLYHLA
jgi:hypothetical protein